MGRITKAMLETLRVMPSDGSAMTIRQIAEARWPDHPYWSRWPARQQNVLSGLACTTGRLHEIFCLFAVRKHHYVITRHGCEEAGMTPAFPKDDHLGDFFEVMIDVFEEDPVGPRGLAALECFHHWALVEHGDLPDIQRARRISRRIVELLCTWPGLGTHGKGYLAAARTILSLCCRCTADALRIHHELVGPDPVQPFLLEALKIGTLSWAQRQLLIASLKEVTPPQDYGDLCEEIGINSLPAVMHFNGNWGATWQLPQEKL